VGKEDEDDTVSITVMPEYRYARLFVYPRFLALSGARREEAVMHELAHVAIQPLGELVETVIESYLGEGSPERKLLEEIARRVEESAVEDVTMAFMRLIERPVVLRLEDVA
jgi:hypothetical protein